MSDNLKPCPFCGSRNIEVYEHDQYVGCVSCGATGPMDTITHDAVTFWNTRHASDAAALKPETPSIYEVVDATGGEEYYTQGVWITMDDAIAALEQLSDPARMETVQYSNSEFSRAEIRERDLGWSDTGRVVYVREWSLLERDGKPSWSVTRSDRVGKGLEAHND